jgi:hypothetical protein
LKLCRFFSLLQCVVLSPSQSLNLKALTRTLDETEVSPFQRVVGGETLDILHGIELERRLLQRMRGAPVCGDRMGSISCDRMGSVSGDRVGRLICYTESRGTRGNLFMLTNKRHNRHYRRL